MNNESDSDFFVDAFVYNNHIFRAMTELEILDSDREHSIRLLYIKIAQAIEAPKTAAEMRGIETEVFELVTLLRAPQLPDGNWLPTVLTMADVLNTTPEKLFPSRLAKEIPRAQSHGVTGFIGKPVTIKIM